MPRGSHSGAAATANATVLLFGDCYGVEHYPPREIWGAAETGLGVRDADAIAAIVYDDDDDDDDDDKLCGKRTLV